MSDYMLVVLEQIERFIEEMDAMGVHHDALPDAVEKFNRALEWAKQEDPENAVWQVLNSLEATDTTAAKFALNCRALSDVLREKARRSTGSPTWLVTEDAELTGSYEGIVEITNGKTFTLKGSVEGKIIVHDNATFVCSGFLDGDVEKNPLGTLTNRGRIEGNIRTVGTAVTSDDE